MWHKGLLYKCSITDFNIPVVGIHSLQVNTSKHCNKEKKLSSKPRGYTLSDTFFFISLPFSSFRKHGTQRYLSSLPNKRQSPSEAGIDCWLQNVVAESRE